MLKEAILQARDITMAGSPIASLHMLGSSCIREQRHHGHRPRRTAIRYRTVAGTEDDSLSELRRQLGAEVQRTRTSSWGGSLSKRQQWISEEGNDASPEALAWENSFSELKLYKKQHNTCRVPLGAAGREALGRWVHNQRKLLQAGEMSQSRTRRLKALDFDGQLSEEATWMRHMRHLREFKAQHGHCRVPLEYGQAQQGLGIWAFRQRKFYASGLLDGKKVSALNDIGFEW